MNAKQLIAAVAVLATGSAFAADNGAYVDHSNAASTKTRAEVRAELENAYADGQLGHRSEFVEHIRIASSKSRDVVRTEALQATRGNMNGSLYFGG